MLVLFMLYLLGVLVYRYGVLFVYIFLLSMTQNVVSVWLELKGYGK